MKKEKPNSCKDGSIYIMCFDPTLKDHSNVHSAVSIGFSTPLEKKNKSYIFSYPNYKLILGDTIIEPVYGNVFLDGRDTIDYRVNYNPCINSFNIQKLKNELLKIVKDEAVFLITETDTIPFDFFSDSISVLYQDKEMNNSEINNYEILFNRSKKNYDSLVNEGIKHVKPQNTH